VAKLHVALVSAERTVWTGEADMVIAKTVDGEVGIMPGHSPVLGTLVDGGVVRAIGTDDGDVVAAVHGGFLSVSSDTVSVLAEIAELSEEIDVARARTALDRALATIEGNEEDAEAALAARRAQARLKAAGQPTS
jgi:F-type H+-transporting ATPase subunit epsilon